MVETLPITIHASDELVMCLTKLSAVINRFEAQFNFQTMTANWYGDEDGIINIALCLLMPEDFSKEQYVAQKAMAIEKGDLKGYLKSEFTSYSDDAFSVFDKNHRQLTCTVAITVGELTLLSQQEKVLVPYLQKKLHKVLNLIAEQLMLPLLES